MATTITISYKAFSNPERNRVSTSLSFVLPENFTHFFSGKEDSAKKFCDFVYYTTNTQDDNNELWKLIAPLLPVNRTHTSLSVGDEVKINSKTYRCADFGWELLSATC